MEECVVPFRFGVGRARLLLGPGHGPLGESHLIVVAAVSEGFSKLSFVVKRLLVSFTQCGFAESCLGMEFSVESVLLHSAPAMLPLCRCQQFLSNL